MVKCQRRRGPKKYNKVDEDGWEGGVFADQYHIHIIRPPVAVRKPSEAVKNGRLTISPGRG